MSKDQLKQEISQVLDHLSDSALEELLQFLKQLDQKPVVNRDHLKRILSEDRDLLIRLAQ